MSRKTVITQLAWLGVAASLALAGCTGAKGDKGDKGPAGTPCTVKDNGNGTKTVTCPDGTTATIKDGATGGAASCTVTDNGNGTKTVACSDGTSVIVSDGANGTNGSSCSVTDNGNGTKTISCTDGTTVTVSDGSSGSSCTVTANPNGTKTVSCTDGTSVTIAPPLPTSLDPRDDFPGVEVHILSVTGASNTDGTFAAGDKPAVKFSLTTKAGIPIGIEELDGAEIWLAGPTANYQHVLPAARDQAAYTNVTTASALNSDGTYTYTFGDAIPATFGVPLWDTTKFTVGELSGALTAGTYTVAMQAHKNYLISGTMYPDVGGDTSDILYDHATVAESHEVVTTANCNGCHDSLRAHGGLYQNTRLCQTCHTAGAEDANSTDTGDATPVTIELRSLIHKIHNGAHLPSVNGVATNADGTRNYAAPKTPFVVGGVTPDDFSAVQFPVLPSYQIAMPRNAGYSALASTQKSADDAIRKGAIACFRCHGDGGQGAPVTPPAQGDLFTVPNRTACGSCHDDVDWNNPYTKNGQTMPAQTNDSTCAGCHTAAGTALSVRDVHTHPVKNPAITPSINFAVSSISGGTGATGNFQAGDPVRLSFTIKDDTGNDFPISSLDSITTIVLGPTANRQVPFPYASTAAMWLSPYDFMGRLASPSTSNKGLMSRVTPTGTPVSEVLVVQFADSTNFTVAGHASGALGGGTLPAATSTNPTGSSIGTIYLTSAAVPQTVTVSFSSATDFTVTGSVSNAMGAGKLPAATAATTWFRSTDGSLSFQVTAGNTAFAPGNAFNLAIVQGGAANPVLFAVTAGRTAFGAGDRFYYGFQAPAATYTLDLPMELPLELLGAGDGTAGQTFPVANKPVWYGFQTVWERTALPGTATTVAAPSTFLAPGFAVASTTGFANNDYVVVDDGLATAEYLQVGKVDAANGMLWSTTPARFAHAAGATIQKATLTFRQEGTDYTYDDANGAVVLTAASTNPWVITYRANARFGWYRAPGDTMQTVYVPPSQNSANLDESWGNWKGKSYVDGTYTASIWGFANVPYAFQGEYQAYRATAPSARYDFLYGAATTVTPYALIDDYGNCNACHEDLMWHGGSRRYAGTCLTCHATAGLALNAYVPPTSGPALAATTANFRTFLHDLHFATFPVMPGGAKNCAKCHGAATVWQLPTDRNHPTEQVAPVRAFRNACSGCHVETAASAHFDAMSPGGVESCEVCHGQDADFAVSVVHRPR